MAPEFHTYREIKQQPRMWLKTLDILLSRKQEIDTFLSHYLQEGYEVVLTGAGTSAYIGDALAPVLFQTRLRGAKALPTTDILTSPYLYFDRQSKVLLVSFARSGNSPESVGAVRAVEKTAGSVAHIFITCNPKGELAQMKGDHILTLLLPPETNDVSLAMTSSYSTMLLTCAMLANIRQLEQHKVWLEALSANVEKAMEQYEPAIEAITRRDFKRAVFLGSGPLKGVAEEARLKLQELTDGSVMCAYDSFLGFRHGPKAVVNAETLMVYFLSPEPAVRRYELDLIPQVNAINHVKASVLVCTKRPDVLPEGSEDLCVEIGIPEGIPPCYGCVAYIFVAQLLGLFKSINIGLSPDSPSISGNISRVVEGVTLYL